MFDKVKQWRTLHDGEEKLNLDVAAQRVGIARKTLDDYHLQLRRARQLGFDFEKNKFAKMGTLRKYVKEKGKDKKFDDKKDDDKALFEENFAPLQQGDLGTSGYIENPQGLQSKAGQLNPLLDNAALPINVKSEDLSNKQSSIMVHTFTP